MVTFLQNSDIAKVAPSVFATEPCERMSDRYSFVSSERMIEQFDALGWGVTRAVQPKSYKRSADHKKHQLGFQRKDMDLTIEDPRSPGSMVFPEILVTNSSDGSSSLKMSAGLFALVCSNGLVVQSLDLGSVQQRHMALTPEGVAEAIENISRLVPALADSIERWSELHLDEDQRFEMAHAGKVARWGETSDIDSRLLLNPRRHEDIGNDLWTVFNRVQENTVRGGFKGEGQKRLSRELTNLDALNRVNLSLWNAADGILQAA